MKKRMLMAAALMAFTTVSANAGTPYPDVSDNSHASPQAAKLFQTYFTFKSEHNLPALMKHFSQKNITYVDAVLGWTFYDYKSLNDVLGSFMPKWPSSAISYPTRISGDNRSALVELTDTPDMFSSEIRALAAVDFKDGKIVRWIDYWDSRAFGTEAAAKFRTPADKFPTDLGYDRVGDGASAKIKSVAQKLSDALAGGDTVAIASLFSDDAVFNDLALRAKIDGKISIQKYLTRVLSKAPYGAGSKIVHIVGNDQGGGYEWVNSGNSVKRGIIGMDLDTSGKIERFTTTWDSGMMNDADLQGLVLAAIPQ